jgi:hypothetical protein
VPYEGAHVAVSLWTCESSKGADVITTVGTPPKSLTQLMMPCAGQIARGRRPLHIGVVP